MVPKMVVLLFAPQTRQRSAVARGPSSGEPPLELSLGRRACIEKLGHRRNQLRWSKRLFQQNAVGHSFRRPIVGGSARHVDDGKCRIDLPDQARNLPTLHRPLEVNVGYQRGVADGAIDVTSTVVGKVSELGDGEVSFTLRSHALEACANRASFRLG
jgi:hypothetical protein